MHFSSWLKDYANSELTALIGIDQLQNVAIENLCTPSCANFLTVDISATWATKVRCYISWHYPVEVSQLLNMVSLTSCLRCKLYRLFPRFHLWHTPNKHKAGSSSMSRTIQSWYLFATLFSHVNHRYSDRLSLLITFSLVDPSCLPLRSNKKVNTSADVQLRHQNHGHTPAQK